MFYKDAAWVETQSEDVVFYFSPSVPIGLKLAADFKVFNWYVCLSFSVLFLFFILLGVIQTPFSSKLVFFRRRREFWPCALKKSMSIKYNREKAENASIGFERRGFSPRRRRIVPALTVAAAKVGQ